LINFAAKFTTFPPFTVKFQSPERTNFVAADRLEGLMVELIGFWVTKISELISPLAEKVFIGVINVDAPEVFPFRVVLLEEVTVLDVSFVCANTASRELIMLPVTANISPKVKANIITMLSVLFFISVQKS
jgi:hypothetical protein